MTQFRVLPSTSLHPFMEILYSSDTRIIFHVICNLLWLSPIFKKFLIFSPLLYMVSEPSLAVNNHLAKRCGTYRAAAMKILNT